MRRRLRRIPAPLGILLVIAVIESVAWATVLPPLQGPDEVTHFAYTQKIVERQTIPWGGHGQDRSRSYSTEVDVAIRWGQLSTLAANLGARPAWTPLDERIWHERARKLDHHDRADGGYVSAMRNPPLYYLYEAVPYLATYPASLFTREYAMRLANLPFLLVVVASTWLLIGQLLRRRWLQTVGTAIVTLNPQLIHLSAIVNPDIALAAIWSASMVVCVRSAELGVTRGRVAGLVALSAASALTQPRGLPLALPAAMAIGVGLMRERRHTGALSLRRRVRWVSTLAASAAALVAYLWYATRGDLSLRSVRYFASYLWQFYLPKLGFMGNVPGSGWTIRDVYIDRFYGTFAQLEVTFPARLNHLLALGSAALAVGAVVALTRSGAVRRRSGALSVLVVAALAYVLALHAAAWRAMLVAPGDPVLTGRYLIPLVALVGVTVAVVIRALPRSLVGVAGVALVAVALAVQLAAVGSVFGRFYA